MSIEVGNKLKGKVTGIKKFGAFVELPEGKSGLVHISEVVITMLRMLKITYQLETKLKLKSYLLQMTVKLAFQ